VARLTEASCLFGGTPTDRALSGGGELTLGQARQTSVRGVYDVVFDHQGKVPESTPAGRSASISGQLPRGSRESSVSRCASSLFGRIH
jgi:hypothetical protein